jgi:hypothetical protein
MAPAPLIFIVIISPSAVPIIICRARSVMCACPPAAACSTFVCWRRVIIVIFPEDD